MSDHSLNKIKCISFSSSLFPHVYGIDCSPKEKNTKLFYIGQGSMIELDFNDI